MPSGPYGYAGAWGYRTDGDAGLVHIGARYDDAQVGRIGFARVRSDFITRYTVLSEHPYLYCEHDPVNAVDPTGNGGEQSSPGGTRYRIDMGEHPTPDMHIYYPDGRETVVSERGGWKRGIHRGRKLIPIPKIVRKPFRPIIRGFIKKVPLIGVGAIGYDIYRTWRDPNSTWIDYGSALLL